MPINPISPEYFHISETEKFQHLQQILQHLQQPEVDLLERSELSFLNYAKLVVLMLVMQQMGKQQDDPPAAWLKQSHAEMVALLHKLADDMAPNFDAQTSDRQKNLIIYRQLSKMMLPAIEGWISSGQLQVQEMGLFYTYMLACIFVHNQSAKQPPADVTEDVVFWYERLRNGAAVMGVPVASKIS